jgi:hypothetical protein
MPTTRHTRIPLTLAAALLLTAGAAAQTTAAGRSSRSTQMVTVTMGARTTFTGPTRWRPGAIRIAAISRRGEQELTLLRFKRGYSYSRFLADGAPAKGHSPTAASALRRLFANTDFLGGANVFPGEPARVTVTVRSGTYYLGEMTTKPVFRRIEVEGAPAAGAPKTSRAVVTAYDFGFRANKHSLPARGTITIRNTGKQIHRLLFVPVKAGTSRAQIGAYLRKTGGRPDGPQPPFARSGPQVGTAMISPGRQIQFSYALPAGTYALLCFQPDTRTGKPQALEGMYGVATLS